VQVPEPLVIGQETGVPVQVPAPLHWLLVVQALPVEQAVPAGDGVPAHEPAPSHWNEP
jgi:hypothetical protein